MIFVGYGKKWYNLPNARAFNGATYDAVWMIPQVVKNKSLLFRKSLHALLCMSHICGLHSS